MTHTTGCAARHVVERVVATGRLVLAGVVCMGLPLDPHGPERTAAVLLTIATAYLWYAAGMAAWSWLGGTTPCWRVIAAHVTDVVLCVILMQLAGTHTSAFFGVFVFVVLSGAIRWHGRGALASGVAAITLYVLVTAGVAYFGTGTLDRLRVVTHCGHLVTVTALLAYVGAHRKRLESELEALARWPGRPAGGDEGVLPALLAQAAAALGAPHVALVWEEKDEPWLRVAELNGPDFRYASEAPDALGEIVSGVDASFVCDDAMKQPRPRAVLRTAGAFQPPRRVTLSPQFQERFRARTMHATRILGDNVEGWLFAFDKAAMSVDDLTLGDIVGHHVTGALELEVRIEQLRERAASGERLRLARELHDGVLQALTAAALQAQAARDVLHMDVAAAEDRLARVQDTVLAEQQAIRHAVERLNPAHVRAASRADGLASLRACVRAVARQWDLDVRLDVAGTSGVPAPVAHEICRMVTEALVNAARHGAARDVRVECETSATAARVVVEYEGRGFEGLEGRHDLASLAAMGLGPRTLMERVVALDGSLCIESRAGGARFEIAVPLPAEGRDPHLFVAAPGRSLRERLAATTS